MLQYARTKAKTLRCFPACFPGTHFETSFCGDSVLLRVNKSEFDSSSVQVLGEVVAYNAAANSWQSHLKVGDVFCKDKHAQMFNAVLVPPQSFMAKTSEENQEELAEKNSHNLYAFHPKLKWTISELPRGCPSNNSSRIEKYCFAVYIVVDGQVKHVLNSGSFESRYVTGVTSSPVSTPRRLAKAESSSHSPRSEMKKRMKEMTICSPYDVSSMCLSIVPPPTFPGSTSLVVEEEREWSEVLDWVVGTFEDTFADPEDCLSPQLAWPSQPSTTSLFY